MNNRASLLADMIRPGESPYLGMFKAGRYGFTLDEAMARAAQCGLPIRSKDVENWENGRFEYEIRNQVSSGINPMPPKRERVVTETGVSFDNSKLSDFPLMPHGWKGTARRFFPCNDHNKPLVQWGWKRDFSPELYCYADARALSPCRWVGQNMMYQNFVVMDIDGVGHGERDEQVIEFGNSLRNITFCMEDPAKQGSFHLYFSTDRLIPVKHFPWAKLDFMGNAVNAAVYLKDKKGNGLPMAELTEEVWQKMMSYQRYRKDNR